jgi:3-dehydroquinate synthetase
VLFSEKLGFLPAGEWDRLRAWLRPYYGKFAPLLQQADRGKILAAMGHDKKNSGSGITFILTSGPGRMEKRAVAKEEASPLLDYALQAL